MVQVTVYNAVNINRKNIMKEQLLAEMILLLHKYFHKLHKFMTIPYIEIGFILCRNHFSAIIFLRGIIRLYNSATWYTSHIQLGFASWYMQLIQLGFASWYKLRCIISELLIQLKMGDISLRV